jgi:hypothetical protein
MNKLREAAQAVVDRWESPNWASATSAPHTGELIADLREALSENALDEMQSLTESEYSTDALVCLSETHQVLGEQLGEALEYELVGRINGTYGGQWVFTSYDEAAIWPVDTAVYVRRVKK